MNSIIKSGNLDDLSAVRPLAALPAFGAAAVLSRQEEESIALRQRITALERDLRERDAAIENLNTDVAQSFEAGKIEGHEAGLLQAQDRQAERLSLLENAIKEAQGELSKNMSSLERLSALLARECLDIILGDAEARAGIVQSIVSAQIAKLDKAMVLGVDLSQEDFPDAGALKELADAVGLPRAMLMARAELSTGACIVNLRLGQMDVGIDRQWGVLRDVLDEIAAPEEAG